MKAVAMVGLGAVLAAGVAAWHFQGAIREAFFKPAPSATDLYAWKDDSGVTHFDQHHLKGTHRVHVGDPNRLGAMPEEPAPIVLSDSRPRNDEHPDLRQDASDIRNKMVERAIDDSP